MEQMKTGQLICTLRKERNLTQKALAQRLNVSDRTISKWERGAGLPDISLLKALAQVFDVDIEKLLDGSLDEGAKNGGNMKKLQFYVCPHCGSIFWGTGNTELTCCGRKQSPLVSKKTDALHCLKVEEIEQEYYITFDHEMTKEHSILFVAWVSLDRATVVRLYPEQEGAVYLPRRNRGALYFYCSQHGLFEQA